MAKDVVKEEKKKQAEQMKQMAEELATAVSKIARGMEILSESRLKESTIIMLVAKSSGVNQYDTQKILNALKELENYYLKVK